MESVTYGGPLVWGHGVLLLGGLVWAAICAVLIAMKWKVPPVVATAPLLVHGLYVAGVALWATRESARFGDDPAQSATLTAYALSTQLAQGSAAVSVLPTAGVLLLGGLFAGVQGRRAWGAPAFVFVLASVAALLPLVGLLQYADTAFTLGRVVLYGLCVLPLAAALAGAHPLDNSREGGLVATVAFATLVASVELLVVSSAWSNVVRALASVSPESKAELVTAAVAEIGANSTLGWVVTGLATMPAVVALLRPAADLTDEEVLAGNVSPSGLRWFGGALALLVPLVWAAARLCADPAPLLGAFTG